MDTTRFPKRSVLVCVAAFLLVVFCFAALGIAGIVGWVTDLPNRVVIDLDEFPIGSMVTESIRAAMLSDDERQQVQCLESLTEGIRTEPEAIPWIQSEFAAELAELRDSPNERIQSLAEHLTEAVPYVGPTP